MATAPQLVSVEEYLHTSYRPDCDYLEGQAFVYSAAGLHEAPPNEVLRCGKMELNLPDLFAR